MTSSKTTKPRGLKHGTFISTNKNKLKLVVNPDWTITVKET